MRRLLAGRAVRVPGACRPTEGSAPKHGSAGFSMVTRPLKRSTSCVNVNRFPWRPSPISRGNVVPSALPVPTEPEDFVHGTWEDSRWISVISCGP